MADNLPMRHAFCLASRALLVLALVALSTTVLVAPRLYGGDPRAAGPALRSVPAFAHH